jgi:hypothetical protein
MGRWTYNISTMGSYDHLVSGDQEGARHVAIPIDATHVVGEARILEPRLVVFVVGLILILRIVGLGYLVSLAAVSSPVALVRFMGAGSGVFNRMEIDLDEHGAGFRSAPIAIATPVVARRRRPLCHGRRQSGWQGRMVEGQEGGLAALGATSREVEGPTGSYPWVREK